MTENERTRLRIKIGATELEYEGNADSLQEELMSAVSGMLKKIESYVADVAELKEPLDGGTHPSSPTPSDDLISTNTIATVMGAKSGTDLARAAAARLILVGGAQVVKRLELLDEMKQAHAFYKSTYRSNLSNMLNRLVSKDQFRLVEKDTYTLSQAEREFMGAVLSKARE